MTPAYPDLDYRNEVEIAVSDEGLVGIHLQALKGVIVQDYFNSGN